MCCGTGKLQAPEIGGNPGGDFCACPHSCRGRGWSLPISVQPLEWKCLCVRRRSAQAPCSAWWRWRLVRRPSGCGEWPLCSSLLFAAGEVASQVGVSSAEMKLRQGVGATAPPLPGMALARQEVAKCSVEAASSLCRGCVRALPLPFLLRWKQSCSQSGLLFSPHSLLFVMQKSQRSLETSLQHPEVAQT